MSHLTEQINAFQDVVRQALNGELSSEEQAVLSELIEALRQAVLDPGSTPRNARRKSKTPDKPLRVRRGPRSK